MLLICITWCSFINVCCTSIAVSTVHSSVFYVSILVIVLMTSNVSLPFICPPRYGVSVAFAPGGRYVIAGTKEGKLQVGISSSGCVCLCPISSSGCVCLCLSVSVCFCVLSSLVCVCARR